MSAWHKALTNVDTCAPMLFYLMKCKNSDLKSAQKRWPHPEDEWSEDCKGQFDHGDMDLTKFDFIKMAKADGWTYDKTGDWLCKNCTNHAVRKELENELQRMTFLHREVSNG